MLSNIYVIYDVKAESFNKPTFIQNHEVARRSIKMLLDQPEGVHAQHPEDFTLYHLGTYDERTALFDFLDDPYPVFKFIEMINNGDQ